MMQIPSNGLRLTTLFIAGSMLLSSLTGCGVYKDWKQKEETRLMQTTREAIARENAERKAEKEANKNWLQRHWTGVSIGTLATWAVGITAFMIFKWPKDGKQGIQGKQGLQGIQGDPGIQGFQGKQGIRGPAGVQGVAGKDGVPAELLEQIQKNTADIQQASSAATRAEDAVKQQSDIIVPLKEKVEQQGKDIKEAKDAAQIAQSTAQIAVNGNGINGQKITEHHLRIETLEKAAKK